MLTLLEMGEEAFEATSERRLTHGGGAPFSSGANARAPICFRSDGCVSRADAGVARVPSAIGGGDLRVSDAGSNAAVAALQDELAKGVLLWLVLCCGVADVMSVAAQEKIESLTRQLDHSRKSEASLKAEVEKQKKDCNDLKRKNATLIKQIETWKANSIADMY